MTRPGGGRPRIVVLDDYERALRRLADWSAVEARADVVVHHERMTGDVLHAVLADADALVLMRDRTPLNAELIARLPRLRYVVFTGTRNAALDVAALAARGIAVGHTDWGPSKDSTAELTWALILAAVKRLEAQFATMRAGGWRNVGQAGATAGGALPGVLAGERLGLVGLGEIGGRVARIGAAFGMEVVAWSPHLTPARAADQGASCVALDELLATSKVVSLHLVPGETTRRLMDARRLAAMRADALLVNTARAALIDMGALAAALAAGRPAMAAIDVFDDEPLAAAHPLRAAPNAVLTPHLGFVVEPVFEKFAHGVVECLDAWLRGAPPVRELKT